MKEKNVKFLAIICILTIASSLFTFAALAAKHNFTLRPAAGSNSFVYTPINQKSDAEQMAYVTVSSMSPTTVVYAQVTDVNYIPHINPVTVNGTGRYNKSYNSYAQEGEPMRLGMRATTLTTTVSGAWNS